MTKPAPPYRIRFNRPWEAGRQMHHIQGALVSANCDAGRPYTKRCEALLTTRIHSHAVLTPSCTAALEMSALLIDIRPGDEIIMPSFTFSSTANAFALRGALPVFVDIDPTTLNIDAKLIPAAISPRTRAIVAMHYASIACDMDAITDIAQSHGLAVIEDAAQCIGASFRGRPLGTLGLLGAFSFHASKNVQCGEGGALLVNDLTLAARAEIIREKGTNRSAFMQGLVDEYVWEDIGSSFLTSELTAALLLAQLEDEPEITAQRQALWHEYHRHLQPFADGTRLSCPALTPETLHNGHIYWIALASAEKRQALALHLAQHGIETRTHYVPLHNSPAGKRYGRFKDQELPITESMAGRLLRLPIWPGLGAAEVATVVETIIDFIQK